MTTTREPLTGVSLSKRKLTFEEAIKDMPACVEVDFLTMKTLEDLRWSCLLQLDLIEEGQDSTEGDDPKPIRRWLKKYGRPNLT